MARLARFLVLPLIGTVFAQGAAFAPPSPGTFPCFISATGWMDPAAIPGLSLTLKKGQEFATVGGSVQETGTYTVQASPEGVGAWADAGGQITLRDTQGAPSASGVYGWVDGQLTLLLLVPDGEKNYQVRCGKASLAALQSQIQARATRSAGSTEARPSTAEQPLQPPAGGNAQRSAVAGLAQTTTYLGMKYNVMSEEFEGTYEVNDYLLYKDGTIRRGWPDVPVEAFDSSHSQKTEPEVWGTYRTQGTQGRDGSYAVTWKNGKQETLKLNFVILAQPGQRLSSTFFRIVNGAKTVPNTSVSASYSISFSADGQFSQSGGVGLTAPTTSVSRATSSQGRYELSGNTLTLVYDDGKVSRLPFAFVTSPQEGGIYLNGNFLVRRR